MQFFNPFKFFVFFFPINFFRKNTKTFIWVLARLFLRFFSEKISWKKKYKKITGVKALHVERA
jgi:hypothetical protein